MKTKFSKQAKLQLIFFTFSLIGLFYTLYLSKIFLIMGFFFLLIFASILLLFSITSIILILAKRKGVFEILELAFKEKIKEQKKEQEPTLEELLT